MFVHEVFRKLNQVNVDSLDNYLKPIYYDKNVPSTVVSDIKSLVNAAWVVRDNLPEDYSDRWLAASEYVQNIRKEYDSRIHLQSVFRRRLINGHIDQYGMPTEWKAWCRYYHIGIPFHDNIREPYFDCMYPRQWRSVLSDETAEWLYTFLDRYGFSVASDDKPIIPPDPLGQDGLGVVVEYEDGTAQAMKAAFKGELLDIPNCINEELV